MRDQKSLEPRIEIFHPLLRHYSPEAAILYGYLKYLVFEQDLPITDMGNESYYDISTTRFEIKEATGLTEGKQIDAELELCLAFLADSVSNNGNVGYDLFPFHEEGLRRFVNKTRQKWTLDSV